MVMTLSLVLLDVMGITGIGVAWLVSQTIVATYLLGTRMRGIWRRERTLSYSTSPRS